MVFFRRTRRTLRRRMRFRRSRRPLRRIIRRVVHNMPETKFYVQPIGPLGVQNTPIFQNFYNGLPQGNTAVTRVGSQITSHRISYRLHLDFSFVAGGAVEGTIRVLVVWPRRQVSNVQLQATLSTITMTSVIDPTIAYVLSDRTAVLSTPVAANGSIGGSPSERTIKWGKKQRGPMQYDIANNTGRSPHLVLVSSLPTVPLSTFTVTGYIRLSYKDM